MGAGEGYIIGTIALLLALFLSVIVFLKFRKKSVLLGCLLQLISFLILWFGIIGLFELRKPILRSGAMVCVRSVNEDGNCRFEETYYFKTDGTYYFDYEKSSSDNTGTPCGNDSWGDNGSYERIDSCLAIKANSNPSFIIYFDLNKREVVPVLYNDTLDVIDADWERIIDFFK